MFAFYIMFNIYLIKHFSALLSNIFKGISIHYKQENIVHIKEIKFLKPRLISRLLQMHYASFKLD